MLIEAQGVLNFYKPALINGLPSDLPKMLANAGLQFFRIVSLTSTRDDRAKLTP